MHPRLRLFRHEWSAFQVCGAAGWCVAAALSFGLDARLGLSAPVVGLLWSLAVAVFFALAMAMKVVTGRERLVYYYHEIAVLAAAAVVLRAFHQPVLRYMDVVALAIGAFLACGRVGCLLAGCCYGRPPFRVQAIESVCVAGIVASGVLIAVHRPPGSALAWYLAAYGVVRFNLEFLRGDRRPYWRGLSEAQWISLVSVASVTVARLHAPLWLVVAAVFALAAADRLRARRIRPVHLAELEDAARQLLEAAPTGICVITTPSGFRVSAGAIPAGDAGLYHFTLSRAKGRLSGSAARRVGQAVARARQLAPVCMVRGRSGVLHFLAREQPRKEMELSGRDTESKG